MTGNIRRGRICVGAMSLTALVLGVLAPNGQTIDRNHLLIVAGLLVVSLVAQLIENSPEDTGSTYGVPVLVVSALSAGLILPPIALTPAIALVALPVLRRGFWHWLAAAAPAVLAAHTVAVYAHVTNPSGPIDLLDCVTLLGGALLFLMIYEGLRGIEWYVIGFVIRTRSPALFASLFTDALYAVLGVVGVGGLVRCPRYATARLSRPLARAPSWQ